MMEKPNLKMEFVSETNSIVPKMVALIIFKQDCLNQPQQQMNFLVFMQKKYEKYKQKNTKQYKYLFRKMEKWQFLFQNTFPKD